MGQKEATWGVVHPLRLLHEFEAGEGAVCVCGGDGGGVASTPADCAKCGFGSHP